MSIYLDKANIVTLNKPYQDGKKSKEKIVINIK